MRIEIIAIGNEIISGHTVNSNASFIGQSLKEKGYGVYRHLALPDDKDILKKEIKASFDVSDIVICCGGLGPTIDDLTKDVVGRLLNLERVIDDKIKNNLNERFPKYTAADKDALVFKDAISIMNFVGTAPGIIVEKDKKALILLPGVPSELKPMFSESIIPYLVENFPISQRFYQKSIGVFMAQETEVNPILDKFQTKYKGLEIGIYPSLGYVLVNVSKEITADDFTYQEVDEVIDEIGSAFPKSVFENSIVLDLHNELIKKKYKIAFAESCTGGAIASALTKIPGASNYLEGSLVTYSNEMKIKLLHVNKYTLEEKGSVSVETVDEMLTGLLNTTDADYVVAVSGIAGPGGGTEKKPVGTVCIGCACKGCEKDIGFIHVQGKREKVIEKSVNTALAILLRRVKYNANTF